MKRLAIVLSVLSAVTVGVAFPAQNTGRSKDLIDRRDGRGPGVTEIAGDLWTQAKWEYTFGKENQQPVDKSFYVPGEDASSK